MKILLSLISYSKTYDQYESHDDFRKSLKDLGIDGIEEVLVDEESRVEKDLVYGVHLPFFTSWLDYYREDKARVTEEFGSLELAGDFYGHPPQDLYKYFLPSLAYAKEYADYSVFHVANTSSLEYLSQRHFYTDEEVIKASANLINTMIKESAYDKDLLLENLYFPGLQFTNPDLTRRLLDLVDYDRLGFMLDIGHLMNTNPYFKSEDEGWAYVEKIFMDHRDLKDCFKGIHLHVSVSGECARAYRANPPDLAEDFYERFGQIYTYVSRIDTHQIARSSRARRVIDLIEPEYLVLEFKADTREEREGLAKDQIELLAL